MDYFGQLADDLVDMAEEIERLYPLDGARVIKGLERCVKLAIDAENVRYERGKRAASAAREAAAQMPGPRTASERPTRSEGPVPILRTRRVA